MATAAIVHGDGHDSGGRGPGRDGRACDDCHHHRRGSAMVRGHDGLVAIVVMSPRWLRITTDISFSWPTGHSSWTGVKNVCPYS